MARYGRPLVSPYSYTWTTWGCLTAATASASARKRISSFDPARCSPSTILRATSRFSFTWRAFQTTPIPPSPSSSSRSYPGTACVADVGRRVGRQKEVDQRVGLLGRGLVDRAGVGGAGIGQDVLDRFGAGQGPWSRVELT